MTAACLAFAAVIYSPLAALTWTSAGLSVLSGERVWMRRSLIEAIRPRPQPARLVFQARMKTLGPAS